MLSHLQEPSEMATATFPSSGLLTREQAAEFLGVKPQTLAVWATAKRYQLPMVKVGSLVRYRLSDLEKFLESRTVGGAE
jgi:excisionase family DNA binding protein